LILFRACRNFFLHARACKEEKKKPTLYEKRVAAKKNLHKAKIQKKRKKRNTINSNLNPMRHENNKEI
jgi:hypothetical protein